MLMNKEKILSASGRGLYFISSLMDEVTFNDKGNQVTAIKRFDR
jgi:anti-sigma regulatory factor (Ser/Thr protein kinase)